MTYRPERGSLPARLIRYLLDNPGLQPTCAEAAKALGVKSQGFKQSISRTIEAGVIVATREHAHRVRLALSPDVKEMPEERDLLDDTPTQRVVPASDTKLPDTQACRSVFDLAQQVGK